MARLPIRSVAVAGVAASRGRLGWGYRQERRVPIVVRRDGLSWSVAVAYEKTITLRWTATP